VPARRALLVLTLVNLLNYLDRFVVSALVESLRASGLVTSDAALGALMTGFVVVYMLASPVFGALADGGRARPPLLAVGVAVWSVATALSAFVGSYWQLLVARAAVGVGEAAYGTVAPAMIADAEPEARRGRAFAVFYAAIPVGSALGYVLGGLVDRAAGWRAAFLVAGVPGLLLAWACLRLGDPPRTGAAPAVGAAATLAAYPRLVRNRPYALTVLGYAAYTFALGGMAFWLPAFLERVRGLPRAQATIVSGGILVATGFAGTFGGGFLADLLRPRLRAADLWVSGLATLAAAPLVVAAFLAHDRAAWLAALVAAELLLFASTGPVNTVIVGAVAPAERGAAVALSIFSIHAFGDVPSPWLIGRLSDATTLATGVLLVPVAVVVAGALWTFAAATRGRYAPAP
jgi:MFS transporter, Spinster family, sphingosine-1-phosphate transporter